MGKGPRVSLRDYLGGKVEGGSHILSKGGQRRVGELDKEHRPGDSSILPQERLLFPPNWLSLVCRVGT